ncbi:Flp family type IVb pilin [Pasteurella multocida]|uniref:Flp family type IVb pilin n=1 Tax=Pasteurella multocida (strain Pm70) TaxID=272843 RepID=Q9CMH1_PASMU|nr:Flp family type IVb pilin [Pasteurella multocida]AAK02939.1 unknown [Pasteurella multocida subsp. multocida str. Pm70]APW55460.1 Flp pilus assembly protein, pilin Flp [Pasteurella multocida subsp. multocida str. HN07]ARA70762.1 fimbrial protein [Pasteurella multocida subsp. multocida]ARA89177.1 fimbrial protein [Pasteurella multocida subsp. septica]ATF74179.1 Flp family type IVb pilin [Pasteurella multocida]
MFSKLTTQAYIAVTESIRNFKKDERGVTAIEYGLIAVAVAVLIVAAFYGNDGLVASLKGKFEKLTAAVTGANVG